MIGLYRSDRPSGLGENLLVGLLTIAATAIGLWDLALLALVAR